MRNLDQVWKTWENLDAAYSTSFGSKREFLDRLVANGDKDKVNAILAKIAVDVESADDTKKFTKIQRGMLALVNNFEQLADNIMCLEEYVASIVAGETVSPFLSFSKLIDLITSVRHPYTMESVDFEDSPVGMELITADSIHKIKLASRTAVMMPLWVRHADQLNLSDSSFHSKVARAIKEMSEKKCPVLFLDKSAKHKGKQLTLKGRAKNIACGESVISVVMV